MRSVLRTAYRLLRAAGRGAAVLSLVAKLLIPIGYMPGALADGGPIVLCGAGMPGGLMAAIGSGADHASLHEHVDALHHVDSHAGHGSPGEHDPESDHGPWERCVLGALAFLAPLAVAGIPSIAPLGSSETPPVETTRLESRSIAVVRARGPPYLHS
jgi:hypothetical protein